MLGVGKGGEEGLPRLIIATVVKENARSVHVKVSVEKWVKK